MAYTRRTEFAFRVQQSFGRAQNHLMRELSPDRQSMPDLVDYPNPFDVVHGKTF